MIGVAFFWLLIPHGLHYPCPHLRHFKSIWDQSIGEKGNLSENIWIRRYWLMKTGHMIPREPSIGNTKSKVKKYKTQSTRYQILKWLMKETLVDCNRARESAWAEDWKYKIQSKEIQNTHKEIQNTKNTNPNLKMTDEGDAGWLQQGTWVRVSRGHPQPPSDLSPAKSISQKKRKDFLKY